jgi:hypothetical protein
MDKTYILACLRSIFLSVQEGDKQDAMGQIQQLQQELINGSIVPDRP